MNKTSYRVIILLLSVIMTGCGKTKSEQENAQSLLDEKLWKTDFTEYGDARLRSIDEICVIPEPLVRREISYVKNGEDEFTWINESMI